jgi:hypothetical protein
MFGWIPAVVLLFSRLEPRRAVIAAFITAWLFLPNASYVIPVLPDYTKMSATCAGVLLGAVMFDSQRLSAFAFSAADLPMLAWMASPLLSSVANGLGLYDGVAAAFDRTVIWGLPWFIGRTWLSSLQGMEEFARGLFLGGLAYVPLCLYEIRMSPQLHRMFYGFYSHPDFAQNMRGGGWRPMVFMPHGLMVGMWMAGATLVGVWLRVSRTLTRVGPRPATPFVLVLAATSVLVKSMGAMILMLTGVASLFASARGRTRLPVLGLLLLPPVFMASGLAGGGLADMAVDAAARISTERAASLKFRVDNEHMLIDKAMQRPVFGWGGWGRSRIYDARGEDISTTDSLWIITLGENGIFGLTALTLVLLAPPALVLARLPARQWRDRAAAPAAAVAMLLVLYMIDNLLNAMVNPVFVLAAGGLAGAATDPAPARDAAHGPVPGPGRPDPHQVPGRMRIL